MKASWVQSHPFVPVYKCISQKNWWEWVSLYNTKTLLVYAFHYLHCSLFQISIVHQINVKWPLLDVLWQFTMLISLSLCEGLFDPICIPIMERAMLHFKITCPCVYFIRSPLRLAFWVRQLEDLIMPWERWISSQWETRDIYIYIYIYSKEP